MADGSFGSLFSASAYQSAKRASGSSFARIMTHNMEGQKGFHHRHLVPPAPPR
jgi:hypothetical protein